jgi:CheY-like chemotaxis protein
VHARHLAAQSEARERQRQQQQGRGRGIVSLDLGDGRRGVAVNTRLLVGSWKTFVDFLMHYIKVRLGEAWGTAQLQQPDATRHPLLTWYVELCRQQAASKVGRAGEIFSAPAYGVWGAYLGVAYDLYCAEHAGFAAEQPEEFKRLLDRLRHPEQFRAARYELKIAGFLLRAGFSLRWQREVGRGTRVGEFLATWPATKHTFWVECRGPQGQTSIGRAVGRLADALRKPSEYERLVFIDLNRPGHPILEANDWRTDAVNHLRRLEQDPRSRSLPPAFVFLTNYPDQYHLADAVPDAGAVLEGFNMRHHRMVAQPLTDYLAEREAYPEIVAVRQSLRDFALFPSTFDASVPDLPETEQWIIGQTYRMGDGRVGVLTDATVIEPSREIALVLLSDGRRHAYRVAMSDEAFRAWKAYPDTFFGTWLPAAREANDPLALYDALYATFQHSTREQLLRFMASWPDPETRESMRQPELAKHYCLCMVCGVVHQGRHLLPQTIPRLRPLAHERS